MPVVRRAKRAAAGAAIPFEQDREAPARTIRDHSFVGVDYPLDDPVAREAHARKREVLLASAATLAVPPAGITKADDAVAFTVTLANSGTGHNLPGGFAFVRQMWLEVTLADATGKVLAGSGVLARPGDDLCDASIVLDPESPMRELLTGCQGADVALVNFQQMLVDRVEVARDATGNVLTGTRGERQLVRAPGSKETVLQTLDGGPVARSRPATGKATTPLAPGETANFPYRFPVTRGQAPKSLSVRLLFRVASPYFLRALARDQPPTQRPKLDELVGALVITEMARISVTL
jgi:hypothetical protein